MKGITLLALGTLSLPAAGANWTYAVYEQGELRYEGPQPPVNLTYPPPGESAPRIHMGEDPRGAILTPAQVIEERLAPHVIIIPPATTRGANAFSAYSVQDSGN